MGTYKEIEGDLIKLALKGEFDVIAHGCNCFNRQASGIAKQMAKSFDTDTFDMEDDEHYGSINKLGTIDWEDRPLPILEGKDKGAWRYDQTVAVVNCYTQFKIKKFNDKDYDYTTTERPVDYQALGICMKKINHIFKGKRIGLPQIGCGKAEGAWGIVSKIIKQYLTDCDVTVVIYKS